VRSFESRTAIWSSAIVTSTQPLLLLSVLFRHTARDRSTIPQPLPGIRGSSSLNAAVRRHTARPGGTLCQPDQENKHELRRATLKLII
jgi:hypothetical protein